MHRSGSRYAAALLFFVAAAGASARAHAQATNTLSVTFGLADLPTTITLCRDPAAIRAFGIDEQWSATIDVDGDPSSGDAGADAMLVVQTASPPLPCAPTSADTATSLVAAVLAWSDAEQTFVDSGLSADVALDFVAHTITVTTDVAGVLTGLTNASRVLASTAGSYVGAAPTFAYDQAGPITADETSVSPADDVANCTSPCGAAADGYPLVDFVEFGTATAQPLPSGPPAPPAFGADTLDVEFDLASLPTTLNLCDSTLFRTSAGYDRMWIAGTDYDPVFGIDHTLIAAHTPLQQGCSTPTPAALASSMQASLFRMDPAHVENGYVFVAPLPVSVDVASGKIVVQADRTDPDLGSLSTNPPVRYFTFRDAASSADGDFPSLDAAIALFATYPQDDGPQFDFGGGFVDPHDDVCTSADGCTDGADPEIDLAGGSMHPDDWIFRDGFDREADAR